MRRTQISRRLRPDVSRSVCLAFRRHSNCSWTWLGRESTSRFVGFLSGISDAYARENSEGSDGEAKRLTERLSRPAVLG